PCSGNGPWVEADLENGMFQGDNGSNTANKGNPTPYVTAVLKNDGQTKYALKGGDSTAGGLTTWWDGPLPTREGYRPMKQEGGIILATGGDNSNRNMGTW
ncbi:alpha-L-arabinofuranosidase, partial [Streptomyces sp. SID11233]|nr:alpha-L-arabinofuranosidase [Streptomyces sp. SID11233]